MSEQIKKIPATIETYEEGKPPTMKISDDGLICHDKNGNAVQVTYWVRYPSYDFVFGVPVPESHLSEEEVGYFQFRNTKTRDTILSIYVDCNELEELTYGFKKTVEVSKLITPKLWKKHQAESEKIQTVELPIPLSPTPMPTPKEPK